MTENDLDGWELSGNNGVIGECSGNYMIGGYGNFGAGAKMKKTFGGLGPHDKVI